MLPSEEELFRKAEAAFTSTVRARFAREAIPKPMVVGTMMAVRNPKAHDFVEIDTPRCIHFLYLTSLLAHKLDEAQDATVS